jgi:ankyrin repeat protein
MKRQRGKGKNAELIRACKEGTLDEVRAALDDGASENATDEEKCSALMWACQITQWNAAESIVAELLERGALFDIQSADYSTTLHFAVIFSNTNVVRMLLDAGARIDHPNKAYRTPLMSLCFKRHFDKEGVEIACLLLDRGANLHCKDDPDGDGVLHYACQFNSAEMVQLLLERKANVNALNNSGQTPLMFACWNNWFGEAIIPILMVAGANAQIEDNEKKTAMYFACASSGWMVKAISSFIPPNGQMRDVLPSEEESCSDPIGVMVEAASYGMRATKNEFMKGSKHSQYSWAIMRQQSNSLCFDLSRYDIFRVMSESVDPKLWYYVICELGTTRHPKTGDTLLHVAARTGKHFAVDSMMRRGFNPFIRNSADQRPLDTVPKESVSMVEKLQVYAQFRPTIVHMEWMGPYFRQRVVAFLCVLTRWRNQGNATIITLDRNIVSHVIFRHLARMEYV